MSKRIKAPAASAFFGNTMVDPVQPEAAPLNTDEDISRQSDLKSTLAEPPPRPTIEAHEEAAPPTLTIEPNRKKRLDKSTNILVNKDDYAEFTKIAKELGYSNNALINRLMNDFVKANKR